MEKLYLKTVSRDLLEGRGGIYKSISLFNFETGTQKIELDSKTIDTVAAQGTTWIRVHLANEAYYDFVTSSVTIFNIDGTIIIMCNDDAEMIDVNYIAKLVKEFQLSKEEVKSLNSNEALEEYYKEITRETEEISKEMEQLYTISRQVASSRLNVQETYAYGKQRLEKINMLNILIKQVAKDNKDEIIGLIV